MEERRSGRIKWHRIEAQQTIMYLSQINSFSILTIKLITKDWPISKYISAFSVRLGKTIHIAESGVDLHCSEGGYDNNQLEIKSLNKHTRKVGTLKLNLAKKFVEQSGQTHIFDLAKHSGI